MFILYTLDKTSVLLTVATYNLFVHKTSYTKHRNVLTSICWLHDTHRECLHVIDIITVSIHTEVEHVTFFPMIYMNAARNKSSNVKP